MSRRLSIIQTPPGPLSPARDWGCGLFTMDSTAGRLSAVSLDLHNSLSAPSSTGWLASWPQASELNACQQAALSSYAHSPMQQTASRDALRARAPCKPRSRGKDWYAVWP